MVRTPGADLVEDLARHNTRANKKGKEMKT